MLHYDNQEVDLNSLFLFSFEKFKLLVSSIAKNQQQAMQRINDIEDKITLREKKIEDLERQLKKQENYMATKFKTMTNIAVNNNPPVSNKSDNANDINNLNTNVNNIEVSYII